jgi:hypothetical protein
LLRHPQFLAEVEQFAQLLVGDVAVESLEQQRSMRRVVDDLLGRCHRRMDALVTEQHAAAESAVAAYFDYAHVLTARSRLDVIGEEMAALVHVMTGETRSPRADAASSSPNDRRQPHAVPVSARNSAGTRSAGPWTVRLVAGEQVTVQLR